MRYFVFSTAIALLLCNQASASLVIDNFSQGASLSTFGTLTQTVALDDDVAGSRTLTIAGPGFAQFVESGVGNTNFITSAIGTSLTMSYTGLPSIDLHSSGAFSGSPLVLDLFDSVLGSFSLDVTYGSGVNTATQSFTISSAGLVGVSGTGFGDGALASAVDSILFEFTTLTIDGGAGVSQFLVNDGSASISAVPEPTSLALLGASMFGGLGIVARRRKKKIVEEVKA